jgi:hypothetical protein
LTGQRRGPNVVAMLSSLADGVWYDTAPVGFLGLELTATMTVLRLDDGGLLVHSPLPLTTERRAAAEALGPIAHLYAPNAFHHRWLAEWHRALPSARVHAPTELATRLPEVRIDRFHDTANAAAFGDEIVEIPIRGCRLAETVLVHRRGRAAVVTDLVHNIGRPSHGWTKLYSRVMGFYDRVALSRVLRWTAFKDRVAARQSVDQLLGHEFDTLVVGHGAPLATGGRDALAQATAWLPGAPT